MKIKQLIFLSGMLFAVLLRGYSQNGFQFPRDVQKDRIKFELINNLVVIPVELNGAKLSFILDTGVNSTIVFSLSDNDSVQLNNATSVKLRGLGGGESITALKSENNLVKIGDARDINHTVYVIFDEAFNMSKKMGTPIHGIIGFDFFRNFVVKTNYVSKRISVYKQGSYEAENCKKCHEFEMAIKDKKPYINLNIGQKDTIHKVNLLIDSGSSDAIWLFDEEQFMDADATNYFNDYLGLGLSGGIFGKRSKLDWIEIGDFHLDNVKVAYPEEESLNNINLVEGRDGSIGGDILKRFTTVMDYGSGKLILKKNGNFKTPFYYNMSGLTIEHDGVVLVKNRQNALTSSILSNREKTTGTANIPLTTIFNFYLVPRFVIADVRENSPADLAGLKKGDEILEINGKAAYHYKLHELISMFTTREGKRIIMVVRSNGIETKRRFTLKKVF